MNAKTIWNRLTLMEYATDENNGKTKPTHWMLTALWALVGCAAWIVAVWIARN